MHNAAFISICLVVFCIPWQQMAVVPGINTLSSLLGMLTISLAGLAVVARARVRKWSAALAFLALYVAWTVASMFWSLNFEDSLGRGFTFLQVFLLTWLIYEFADTQGRIIWLMLSYIGGAGFSLLTMLVAPREAYVASTEVERLTGGSMNANDIAATLCIAVIMAAYLAMQHTAKGGLLRKALWAFVPCASIGVFMTGSRMGIIVLAIDAAFIAWMAKAGGIKAIIALLIVASPTAYYIPRIVNSAVFDRFAQGTESHTFQERMEFWQAGLEYWASHPIQGCGGGCFANAIASKVQKTNVSHNTYVTILVETGIVGFALASAFWILLLRMILRLPRHERVLCFGLLAVWAVCSMSLTWEYHKDTWLIYGVILAEYAATQALQSRQAAGAVSKAAP